jgi:hypothetical protein
MAAMIGHQLLAGRATCWKCGEPIDSRHFDEQGFTDIAVGARVVLARFQVPRRFCGRLQFFAQFTDQFALDPSRVETPELSWSILVNNQAVAPYAGLTGILNPWGFGSYETDIRLDDGALVEFVLRVLAASPVNRAGGRIVGRYWYNTACADVDRYG